MNKFITNKINSHLFINRLLINFQKSPHICNVLIQKTSITHNAPLHCFAYREPTLVCSLNTESYSVSPSPELGTWGEIRNTIKCVPVRRQWISPFALNLNCLVCIWTKYFGEHIVKHNAITSGARRNNISFLLCIYGFIFTYMRTYDYTHIESHRATKYNQLSTTIIHVHPYRTLRLRLSQSQSFGVSVARPRFASLRTQKPRRARNCVNWHNQQNDVFSFSLQKKKERKRRSVCTAPGQCQGMPFPFATLPTFTLCRVYIMCTTIWILLLYIIMTYPCCPENTDRWDIVKYTRVMKS